MDLGKIIDAVLKAIANPIILIIVLVLGVIYFSYEYFVTSNIEKATQIREIRHLSIASKEVTKPFLFLFIFMCYPFTYMLMNSYALNAVQLISIVFSLSTLIIIVCYLIKGNEFIKKYRKKFIILFLIHFFSAAVLLYVVVSLLNVALFEKLKVVGIIDKTQEYYNALSMVLDYLVVIFSGTKSSSALNEVNMLIAALFGVYLFCYIMCRVFTYFIEQIVIADRRTELSISCYDGRLYRDVKIINRDKESYYLEAKDSTLLVLRIQDVKEIRTLLNKTKNKS